jgi:zinc D-Ala-D-Ala dipeptidase
VAHFVRWAQRIDDIKNKPEFYPDVPKRDLFKQGYISERSAHSRGSTVDLTLVRRADARELDMGSPFDFFSPKSWPSDTSVSAQAHKNRALLAAAMMRGGFRPMIRNGGTTRSPMSRSRTCISIFRSGDRFARASPV